MANYPTTFSPEVNLLLPSTELGKAANDTIEQLAERGRVAGYGLPEYFAGAIAVIAAQPHIVEYCPKDASRSRFATKASTRLWLDKEDGRGLGWIASIPGVDSLQVSDLLKLDTETLRFEDYGWSGFEKNKAIPGADITTAYRVSEEGRLCKGMGHALAKMIPAIAIAKFGADPKKISLETWASNAIAVHIYDKNGFEQIASKSDEERLTQQSVGTIINGNEVYEREKDGVMQNFVKDTRLYKLYNPAFLER